MMAAAARLSSEVGIKSACELLKVSRAGFYRAQAGSSRKEHAKREIRHPRSLAAPEQVTVLDTLHSERFVDQAPQAVYATLLDEGQYLCSISTMYRLLNKNNEVKERRMQRRHPKYSKPELLATGPNQLWSWDITKLSGPVKWSYYHLYVIMDIFSRYIVGWMVAHRESSALAKKLISESIRKQKVEKAQLTLHADRGSSMKSKAVALLLSDLGVTKTHSRPHTSNDNPYSESQFKTLKYRPEFPKRFGSIEDARAFCSTFFAWYNKKHCHSGIALYSPEIVHYGRVQEAEKKRQKTLDIAYQQHPERFVKIPPSVQKVPEAVWINKPALEKNSDPSLH